jgi:hypothetical protein
MAFDSGCDQRGEAPPFDHQANPLAVKITRFSKCWLERNIASHSLFIYIRALFIALPRRARTRAVHRGKNKNALSHSRSERKKS